MTSSHKVPRPVAWEVMKFDPVLIAKYAILNFPRFKLLRAYKAWRNLSKALFLMRARNTKFDQLMAQI